MGTIRFNPQRKDCFVDYIAANGERMRQTIGAGDENRRLAKKVLAQREAEAQLGQLQIRPTRTPRFAEYGRDWLTRKRSHVRPETFDLYEDLFDHHLQPYFGDMYLGSIKRRDVESYLETARTTPRGKRKKPSAPKTINHTLMVLKSIFSDAIEHKILLENVATRVSPLPNAHDDEVRFLTPEQVAALLGAAKGRWRTLYLVAVHTGLRRGELLALRWSDVDMQARTIAVRRQLGRIRDGEGYAIKEAPLKTRYSKRTVDFSDTVYEALLTLPAGDDPKQDYVFLSQVGGPIDPDNVDRAYKSALTLAGLPAFRFHDLRHTHASLLVAAGVHPKAIQARMGHASITTTLNTYGHLMPSAFVGVGEKVQAILSVPSPDSVLISG